MAAGAHGCGARAQTRSREHGCRRRHDVVCGGAGGQGTREESEWSGMGTVDGWTKGETFFQGFPRGCCFQHAVRRLPPSLGHYVSVETWAW